MIFHGSNDIYYNTVIDFIRATLSFLIARIALHYPNVT